MADKTLAEPLRERFLFQGSPKLNARISAACRGWRRQRGANRQALVLAGLVLAVVALAAGADDAPAVATRVTPQSAGDAAPRPAGRPASSTPSRTQAALERRIGLLARELDLDAAQQLKVRALLERQREQILRLWNDESLPSAIRVKQTQSISSQTQDGIRALLTDAQKQKYSKPRPADAAVAGTSPELETWMNQVNGR